MRKSRVRDLIYRYLCDQVKGGYHSTRTKSPSVHKKPGLRVLEEDLVDHIFVQLGPQVEDDEEVRNPKTTA
ncbi:hypothetical protein TNCV_3368251 [Trichonephila clavipes]|nr:hypothetical protein TNCV_3368251 [Trichonephila clavipes]